MMNMFCSWSWLDLLIEREEGERKGRKLKLVPSVKALFCCFGGQSTSWQKRPFLKDMSAFKKYQWGLYCNTLGVYDRLLGHFDQLIKIFDLYPPA